MNPFKKKIVRKRDLKERQGKMLMDMATQRGKVELKPNLTLYSAAGMAALELKDNEGNVIEFTSGAFYLALPHIAYKCADPLKIIEAMNATKNSLHETIISKESVIMPLWENLKTNKKRKELPLKMGRRKMYL